jgi:hypothetical protein
VVEGAYQYRINYSIAMSNRFLLIIVAYGSALVILILAGSFFPGGLDWGFHWLAFLPFAFRLLYLIVAAVTILALVTGCAERLRGRFAQILPPPPRGGMADRGDLSLRPLRVHFPDSVTTARRQF